MNIRPSYPQVTSIFIMLLLEISLQSQSFGMQWQNMQNIYTQLIKNLEQQDLIKLETRYCHTYWQEQKTLLKQILLGNPDPDCFMKNPIKGTMVCSGYSQYQQYEIDYIRSCVSELTANQILKYQDTRFPGIPFECAELNCSSNTLVHLYYAAHILEHTRHPNRIIEFGGGYGNLARILKTLCPETSIIIIDLPELIALQYLFLSATLEGEPIYIHSYPTENYVSKGIHLVPIHLIDQLDITTDIFVSTFGLSETPSYIQSTIANKRFFDAQTVYITGQIDGWYPYINFEKEQVLKNSLISTYNHVNINLFHYSFNNPLKSYEIVALQ